MNEFRLTYVVIRSINLYENFHIISSYIFLFSFEHDFCCRNFCVRRDFVSNPKTLQKRLMVVGFAMLLLSPFLVIFMLAYLFLRHAEQFYNHPSTASSRRWSNLSRWIFREFNEVSYSFSWSFIFSSLLLLSWF